ncbi:hypothetical protein GYMLUDRAFT_74781 [Collybiopsis luxurians FD-317 M1]|uniref:Pheromone n=1 Tax=Collybiopsis luxurians FD-317 M1 TaxID=944289 RepID=A0A0D0B5U8_9AGAR|nr:hypothetical protein GYMLUDRAFT_74781 [Collybiopsis luxurians FD-317 M1]
MDTFTSITAIFNPSSSEFGGDAFTIPSDPISEPSASPSTLPVDSEHVGEGVADTGFCVIV